MNQRGNFCHFPDFSQTEEMESRSVYGILMSLPLYCAIKVSNVAQRKSLGVILKKELNNTNGAVTPLWTPNTGNVR